jgi:hypothetical protein
MDQTIPPKPSSGMTMYFVMFIMFIIIVVLAICVYQFIAKPIMDDQAKKEKENKDAAAAEKAAGETAEAKKIAAAATALRLADEASANKYSYLPNMDRNADNLAGGVPGSLKSCRQSCDNTTGCVAFSVTKDYTECFLKTGYTNPTGNNGMDLYYNKPSTLVNRNYTKLENKISANSNNLSQWLTGSTDNCQKSCDITPGCKGFVYNKSMSLCTLKGDVTNPTADVNYDLYTASA